MTSLIFWSIWLTRSLKNIFFLKVINQRNRLCHFNIFNFHCLSQQNYHATDWSSHICVNSIYKQITYPIIIIFTWKLNENKSNERKTKKPSYFSEIFIMAFSLVGFCHTFYLLTSCIIGFTLISHLFTANKTNPMTGEKRHREFEKKNWNC